MCADCAASICDHTTGASSVILTQTYPAAPYVCRTGIITLRCQYDVEALLFVQWIVGGQVEHNVSNIHGHTTLTSTGTYQNVVVDNYTYLRMTYRCSAILRNGTNVDSQLFVPVVEGEFSNSSIPLPEDFSRHAERRCSCCFGHNQGQPI